MNTICVNYTLSNHCLNSRAGQGEVYKPTPPPPNEQVHNSINELADSDCKPKIQLWEIGWMGGMLNLILI